MKLISRGLETRDSSVNCERTEIGPLRTVDAVPVSWSSLMFVPEWIGADVGSQVCAEKRGDTGRVRLVNGCRCLTIGSSKLVGGILQ